MMHGAKCDASGNIYARPFDTMTSGPGEAKESSYAPIQQMTPEGKLAVAFRHTQALHEGTGKGIFVSNNGDVYQAALARGNVEHGSVYVVEFGKDGSVISKTELETGAHVEPWHLAVFPSGRFLVNGETGKTGRTPYTAVFEANGKLVKQSYEPEDEYARGKAEAGDPEFGGTRLGSHFVSRGDVTLGSDGNAYLLHADSHALIYVISPAGEVIRKMRVEVENSGLGLGSIKYYSGRLAIAFGQFGQESVLVTDLMGKSVASYAMENNKSDFLELACYDSDGFTFLSADSGSNLYLLKAPE